MIDCGDYHVRNERYHNTFHKSKGADRRCVMTKSYSDHILFSRRDFLAGSLALALALGSTVGGISNAFAADSDFLSKEQIAARFDEIRNCYSSGDELSEADAEFVSKYATSQQIATRGIGGNSTFYMTASTVDAYVIAQGYAYHNGTISYTYGADVSVTKQSGGTPQWMEFSVTCDSYGVGQNGNTTFNGSHTCSHHVDGLNSFYANLSDGYNAYTVYWNLTLRLTGTSAGGNYFSGVY